MGIGNLVKEMLPSAPYINPPFAFPTSKEKRNYISASARTQLAFERTGFLFLFLFYFICILVDGTSIHVDALTRPCGQEKKIKKYIYIYFFSVSTQMWRFTHEITLKWTL
jgi:hypothetical protein